jgi:hypothetical protein
MGRQHALFNRLHQGWEAAPLGGDDRDPLEGTARRAERGRICAWVRARAWFGVSAPRNTSTEIVEELNKAINAILADPKMNGTSC